MKLWPYQVDKRALLALAFTIAAFALLVRKIFDTYGASSEVKWVGVRFPHATTTSGEYASVACIVLIPVIVWLTHKAFFSRYKR